jgi:hypothetical protein
MCEPSNSNGSNSPATPSRSSHWIVDNIRSLISSNHDDELNTSHSNLSDSNDTTLTLNQELENENVSSNKPTKSSLLETNGSANPDVACDIEVEKSRALELNQGDSATETNETGRIPKRPFSPEEIVEQNYPNMQHYPPIHMQMQPAFQPLGCQATMFAHQFQFNSNNSLMNNFMGADDNYNIQFPASFNNFNESFNDIYGKYNLNEDGLDMDLQSWVSSFSSFKGLNEKICFVFWLHHFVMKCLNLVD